MNANQAVEAYARGVAALEQATNGEPGAIEEAIAELCRCLALLESRETWLILYAEACGALGDAYLLRTQGDPLDNVRLSATHFRAALAAHLDHWWVFLDTLDADPEA